MNTGDLRAVQVIPLIGILLVGCRPSPQQVKGPYSPSANASYRIVSDYRMVGEGEALLDMKIAAKVSVDAKYSQEVKPSGSGYTVDLVGTGGHTEARPVETSDLPSGFSAIPDFAGSGNENHYVLEISDAGRLLAARGFEESAGISPTRPIVGQITDLAAFCDVVASPGGYPPGELRVGQSWADRVPVEFGELGSHEISCESKVVAFERLNGEDCAVIESTVQIPVGEVYATLVSATTDDMRLESSGVCTVHARSHVTKNGRVLLQSEGDFSLVLPQKWHDRRKPEVWIEGEAPREFELPGGSGDAQSENEETYSGMNTAEGTFRVTLE